jgi:hypothetical protein
MTAAATNRRKMMHVIRTGTARKHIGVDGGEYILKPGYDQAHAENHAGEILKRSLR